MVDDFDGNYNDHESGMSNINCKRRYRLQAITRDLSSLFGDEDIDRDSSFVTFLHILIKLGITQGIRKYTLITSLSWKRKLYPDNSTLDEEHLNEIMFDHYDKHLLLKTIVIKLSDTLRLLGMANIFLYLIDKRKQLLNRLMCRIENIQIEIRIEKPRPVSYVLRRGQTQTQSTYAIEAIDDDHDMFGFAKDCDYNIDQKQINVMISKCNNQEFGVIYQNVIAWLARIWNQNSTKAVPIANRTILIKVDKNDKL